MSRKRERHGRPPEYRHWAAMIQRCTNPNSPDYARYGGAGIGVCDRWRNSFLAFMEDMGPRPSAAHSIDRIYNFGGYKPDNCRWATRFEQAQNQAKTMWITALGQKHCLSEWARLSGIPLLTIWSRITKLGWTPERAVTWPRRGRQTNAKLTPETLKQIREMAARGLTAKAIAPLFGIAHSTACRAISGRTYATGAPAFDAAIAIAEQQEAAQDQPASPALVTA